MNECYDAATVAYFRSRIHLTAESFLSDHRPLGLQTNPHACACNCLVSGASYFPESALARAHNLLYMYAINISETLLVGSMST